MAQIEQPKVVRKKLFSPIWLLPLVALALGAWLGVKSIRESGIDVRIHFPSATGIDVGKTLVRYQGLNVGKVVDVSIDDELKGVNVDLLMDYRAEPLLHANSKFWLVTPKASITGVEGLDALFSGNYIGLLPGDGDFRDHFEAEQEAPPVLPGSDGLVIELSAEKLGSLDVGSPVFYRQIPVGEVVSYRLDPQHKVLLKAYIEKQYTALVRKDSHFWNVSGVQIDASLSGIKVNTASLASLIAGGINFSSPTDSPAAEVNQGYKLYASQQEANGGVRFVLTAKDADGIKRGTDVIYRGVTIGEVESVVAEPQIVAIHTRLDAPYSELLGRDAKFWREGADISLSGFKHAGRLVSGDVIEFLPGSGSPLAQYPLADIAPKLDSETPVLLTLTAAENPGVNSGAEIRYRQVKIGQVTQVRLADDFAAVLYQAEILPEFKALLTEGSDFIAEAPLDIKASLEGVEVKSGDLTTLTKGVISLRHSHSKKALDTHKPLALFASAATADAFYQQGHKLKWTLYSDEAASVVTGSPVYYKKMQIGAVTAVDWQATSDRFAVTLAVDSTFAPLLKNNIVFWQNPALSVDASLTGVKLQMAPLNGALKGSIALAKIDGDKADSQRLYTSESLARSQAQAISLVLPADAPLQAHAAIRYQGTQIGEVTQVILDADLQHLSARAYLYGKYAAPFLKQDSQYRLQQAQISLKGVEHPEALLTGAFIAATPGNASSNRVQFTIPKLADDYMAVDALHLQLNRATLGSVKEGTGIFFRGIQIGQITDYRLKENGAGVLLNASIAARYRHLVNQSSRFYDLSGIKVDLGLFSGAQIETGSLETILAGGIGVVTELDNQQAAPLNSKQTLAIYAKAETDWLKWQPNLNE
ncbi:MlaD family protein [Shewanella dokdonensis]|uniref:MCE family protein n=1 Tax=Shewanella dokdonensis TaxID=712036 RepID=A0ABX8DDX5_9GAMM|nr:MlaD family protein [Shewanella dokdonensis]MCL1073231.1 MlaD family protein [Shewanella dokdonensis]QVK22923.1 MCE family protein [Shewanella dokdonensis]